MGVVGDHLIFCHAQFEFLQTPLAKQARLQLGLTARGARGKRSQQQHHQQLLHHYYSPGDQVKDQGLVLPLSHQQDHHGHHLTAAGLMQAVAAEIQLNEDQDQLNPNANQNSPYPIYSYYRSEGERANNGSPGADLPWR